MEAIQDGLNFFFRLTVEEFLAFTVDKTEIKENRIVGPDGDLFAIAFSPECDRWERGTAFHRLGSFHFLREWKLWNASISLSAPIVRPGLLSSVGESTS